MPTRQEVYAAIDSEREYQGEFPLRVGKSVDESLILVKDHYNSAVCHASHPLGGTGAELHIIRKLAALCVACMEQHGSFLRYLDGSHSGLVYGSGSLHRLCVYSLIDSEREYQINLPYSRTVGGQHTVCGFLCMFDTYLRRAIDGWVLNAGVDEALDNIRKLAGICVQCMERHGAPHRA